MNNRVVSLFAWKFLERIGAQGISFILTIILARLLSPDDYGLVALLTVFISLATTFVQCGFNTALIQKKYVTDSDYCAGMAVSIGIAGLLYFVFFLAAPVIADFYDRIELIEITRVLPLVLFPGALSSIQVAKLTRELKFKKIFICSTAATMLSASIGILCAWKGWGAWALVFQQLLYQIFNCAMTAIFSRWRLSFDNWGKSMKEMLPFGSRILASNLLVTLFQNLRTLIIGKKYSSESLGYFNRGKQFPQTIMESINGTIQTVLLPLYSRKQNDKQELSHLVRISVRISCFLIFPFLIGLACIAPPMINLLLTEKWMESVPYVQIFVVSYICQPVQITTAQAMRAAGDSKTPLKIEAARKAIETALLLISIPFGVKAIALSSAVAGIMGIVVAMKANSVVIHYRVREQLSDIGEPVLYSLIMALAVILSGPFISGNLPKLICGILIGAGTYSLAAFFMKSKCLEDVILIFARQKQ